MKLICCGESLVDFVSVAKEGGDGLFTPVAGGGPYNSAIAAARLGIATWLLGSAGNDWLGQMLRDTLEKSGVNDDFFGLSPNTTPISLAKEENGVVEYVFHGVGPKTPILEPSLIPSELPTDTTFFLFGTLATAIDPIAGAIEKLAERQKKFSINYYDVNIRPSIISNRESFFSRFERLCSCAHIVKISDDDASWLYPEINHEDVAKNILNKGAHLVLLTMGEKGAVAMGKNGVSPVVSPQRIGVVDTVGAGDAFNAAFISSLSSSGIIDHKGLREITESQLAQALAFAVAAGAMSCTRRGANPPTISELNDFISSHNH